MDELPKKASKSRDLNARRKEAPEPKVASDLKVPLNKVSSAQGLLEKCSPGTLPTNVTKEMLYAGKPGQTNPPYPKGSRLRIHYTAVSLTDGKTYDDSRKHPKPMEFLIGKKFKVEIWELALNTMFVGEVAKFLVPKEYCFFYPMVSKVLRNSFKPCGEHKSQTSCCAHNMLSGTGYEDLDQLLKEPTNLAFTFELLEVSLPGQYEMESWYMTDEQKAASITELQEEGNNFYWDRHYKDASNKYLEALSRIEQLMNKETPGSPEMEELRKRQVPLLLNHGMCRQQNRDYYEAIKYNNMALEIEPDNVKGLFRRGQCYRETAHWQEARADLRAALKYDPTLRKGVKSELEFVDEAEETLKTIERLRCKRMLEQEAEGVPPPPEPAKETDLQKQKRLVSELLAKMRLQEEEAKREQEERANCNTEPQPPEAADQDNTQASESTQQEQTEPAQPEQ